MTPKERRALDAHAALHELERQCVKIGKACIAITDLYGLNVYAVPPFRTDETKAIMELASSLMKRASARHEELTNGVVEPSTALTPVKAVAKHGELSH